MRHLILTAVGLLGLLATDTFADNKPGSTPVAQVVQVVPDQKPVQRGTLYRVRHRGNTSYLFGTIHVGKAEFYPLGPAVMNALAKSSKVAVELDTRNTDAIQAALQKHGLYPSGDSLKNHLPVSTLEQLKQALAKVNIPLENVMQMKPWFVANLLLVLDLANGGLERAQGMEAYLLNLAQEKNKQVVELEGADFQFALFNQMSEPQQVQFLDEVMAEIKAGKMHKDMDALANAWAKADAKELTRLVDEILGEKTWSSEFTQRVLLDQRNPAMADKIEVLLKHDKSTFVGVGLLHLIGDKSVPTLLKQRGYVVERMY